MMLEWLLEGSCRNGLGFFGGLCLWGGGFFGLHGAGVWHVAMAVAAHAQVGLLAVSGKAFQGAES